MKRLLRRFALLLMLAWLPMSTLAAAALPNCAGHAGAVAASASGDAAHHGDGAHPAGSAHHVHHHPGGSAPDAPATTGGHACAVCGLCHQSGQVQPPPAVVAAPPDVSSAPAARAAPLPSRFVPDPLRRPPRA
jgi:hypothetical protein